MSHRVIFTPEAEEQLVALYRYIADVAYAARRGLYTRHGKLIKVFKEQGYVRLSATAAKLSLFQMA